MINLSFFIETNKLQKIKYKVHWESTLRRLTSEKGNYLLSSKIVITHYFNIVCDLLVLECVNTRNLLKAFTTSNKLNNNKNKHWLSYTVHTAAVELPLMPCTNKNSSAT